MWNSLLKGINVLDLSSVLAGPLTGSFFAECGAKVVKVENEKTTGDVTRTWRTAGELPSSISAYYAAANYGKEVLLLDYTKEAHLEKVYELVRTADIVISNLLPTNAAKLGVDYDQLQRVNPLIVYGEINGFSDEPERVAYDMVLQAETGFMYINGSADSGPIKMPVALIDVIAAHHLKEGLLLGLIHKMKTQKGAKVRVSLKEAAIASLANQATNWLMCGQDAKPLGSLHPNIAPYGEMFRTMDDKSIVLAVGSNAQFEALLQLLCIASQDSWITNAQRVANRIELAKVIAPKFLEKTASEWMVLLNEKRIPAGVIKRISEVLEDPKIKHLIVEELMENVSTKRIKTSVFDIIFAP
jgi:crotonobetainyl-CoA:carnitine CoA-transferase CaiB-like acyl-CoA transferase